MRRYVASWPVPLRNRAGEGGSGDGGEAAEEGSELTSSSLLAARVPSFIPSLQLSRLQGESLLPWGLMGLGSEVLKRCRGGALGRESEPASQLCNGQQALWLTFLGRPTWPQLAGTATLGARQALFPGWRLLSIAGPACSGAGWAVGTR